MIFRDHLLSDLIGFVYSKMDAAAAATDFLERIRANCAGMLHAGRDALVPIILDGENAWEYYHRNGRPFLRELYRRISEDPGMAAIPVREAFERMVPEPLGHIFPGSWINANFNVWIGAEEDNRAWNQLLRARQAFDEAGGAGAGVGVGGLGGAGGSACHVPEDRLRLAYEELLIAEGSDWCWWYGPEHDSPNRVEFDELYRSHLANVYRFLNLAAPEELSRPILRVAVPAVQIDPSGPITPVIDGEVSSFFEWLGAGAYRVDERTGSMHGKKFLMKEMHFGSDGTNFYVRVDFHPGHEQELAGMEARLTLESLDGARTSNLAIAFWPGAVEIMERRLAGDGAAPEAAFSRVLEVRVALQAAGIAAGAGLRFQCSLWKGGLPMDAAPQQGWIEMRTTNPAEIVA